jgi:hypothetical protein
MLLILVILPNSWAINVNENKSNVQSVEGFYNCKIVSSGITEKQVSMGLLKIINFAFAFFIEIHLGEDGESFIYSADSGIEEGHYIGAHNLKLYIFRGAFSYQYLDDVSLKTIIDGKVLFVKAEAE